VVATRPVKLEHVIGGSAPFVELEVMDNRGRTGLLWIQLRVSGHVTSQDWVAKIWQAVGVTKGRNDAQAVVLAAVCADDCIEARDRLNESAVHVTEVVYLSVDEQIARILVREGGA
jgi:hypothetical protein